MEQLYSSKNVIIEKGSHQKHLVLIFMFDKIEGMNNMEENGLSAVYFI
jgi:hypothetical protein